MPHDPYAALRALVRAEAVRSTRRQPPPDSEQEPVPEPEPEPVPEPEPAPGGPPGPVPEEDLPPAAGAAEHV
ncbi:hypothetical protein GCM10018787_50260 [Streptomyces thermodiastaticus]|jgi:hypothetical protein|nr:hypothetical protein GCM10018787_50260 [Streptomyces thermodiastaticus]